ncbi:GntR family transcriptional regulator [Corynebacterium sp. TAE3-ERU12]|uniref:GntR family transcriptional regulator n=1 Tax=Corynebacterium sp. TAE3-ERU12 TaxID=2849491 RepID=UPI001C462D54|nr:GntR family transcriptional regulator [Corynebacterium sp. TAE3-ERU12]MBV7295787.1 GntR family transcriptional regulator [Corynebacterium sp. TAE3-ERU12]
MADSRPIYQRIADELRNQISSGMLAEGDRAPSTNELSAFYSVNPTTSGKALTTLVAEELLEKRRGLGMFVVAGARDRVLEQRRAEFGAQFIVPMLTEARALGMTDSDVDALIAAERSTQ